jgi:hypothetical protein
MHTITANLDRPPRPNQPAAAAPPNISTRAFIQWLPDPPSEPTSTEVLTSRQKFFVDIRILKKEGNSPSPLSSDIDWAFAGRSESHQNEPTGTTSTRWHHTVDSRFLAHPESVIDQAQMLPEDPETGIALEKGSMVNPGTGVETAYVEGWRETEVKHVPEPSRDILEAFERDLERRGVRFVEGDAERKVVVRGGGNSLLEEGSLSAREVLTCCDLQHEDAARRSRGMVVRVGQFCQGVLRIGDEFAAERWECTPQGGWQKVFASGSNLNMPCDVACHLAIRKLRVGSEVVYGPGETWQCVEEDQWEV